MRAWAGLYGMVWLVVLELLVALDPRPPSWLIYVHAALGVLIILLAWVNFSKVRATTCPGRTKRTVRVTLWFTVAMAFLGIFLWLGQSVEWPDILGFSIWDLADFLHVFLALAILAQAASAATSFDMWEEGEFARNSEAGEIPPPVPARG